MTAFGRGETISELGHFLVEIQSVNRKHLEVVIYLPKEFLQLDPKLRKIISRRIGRGRVSIYLAPELNPAERDMIKLNTPLAKQLKDAYEKLQRDLGYENAKVDFSLIAKNKEIIAVSEKTTDVKRYWNLVKEATEKALDELIAMKTAEGESIKKDFINRLQKIKKIVSSIEKYAPDAIKKYRHKLKEKIATVSRDMPNNEEKILREIAIFADKVDITEELTRMKSHIAQFHKYINSNKPIGRTLDFLVQEMHRELNTTSSKSFDISISNLVVKGKSELEKIREQVQNIE